MDPKLQHVPDGCEIPFIKHSDKINDPVPWEQVDKVFEKFPVAGLIETLHDKSFEERARTYRMGKILGPPDEYGRVPWARLRVRMDVSESHYALFKPEERMRPECDKPVVYQLLDPTNLYICNSCKMVHKDWSSALPHA